MVLHPTLTGFTPTLSNCKPLRFYCLTPSHPRMALFRSCLAKWTKCSIGMHVITQLGTSADEFILEASTLKITQDFQVWMWAVDTQSMLLGVSSVVCNGFQVGLFNSRGWTGAILPLLNSMFIFSTHRLHSSLYIYYPVMHLATHTRSPELSITGSSHCLSQTCLSPSAVPLS